MKIWDEHSEHVERITPDKERARSIIKVVELREKDLIGKVEEFSTLIVESYYEIIKELITAVMYCDGWKTLSHELLIGYLSKFYKEISSAEIYTIDQLRKTRNDINYRGFIVKPEYLKRSRENILEIIKKLKGILDKKVKI